MCIRDRVKVSFQYNSYGQVTQQADISDYPSPEVGLVTDFEYGTTGFSRSRLIRTRSAPAGSDFKVEYNHDSLGFPKETTNNAGATTTRAGDALSVTLVWQALAAPTSALTAFVHLLGPDGALVAQSDAVPGGGYATTDWAPGEVVVDTHKLILPAAAPEGSYRLVTGLYDPVTGQRAQVVNSSGAAYADQAAPLFTGELP